MSRLNFYCFMKLPLCNRAVSVMPYGVLPLVRSLILFKNELLVNLNSKSGNLGHLNSAVNELKVILVKSIVKNALANVIVDTDRLLLNN